MMVFSLTSFVSNTHYLPSDLQILTDIEHDQIQVLSPSLLSQASLLRVRPPRSLAVTVDYASTTSQRPAPRFSATTLLLQVVRPTTSSLALTVSSSPNDQGPPPTGPTRRCCFHSILRRQRQGPSASSTLRQTHKCSLSTSNLHPAMHSESDSE
eukprot:3922469-Rhodomonas_salina.1